MSEETKRRFFSGDTLQQALVQAASYYNLEPHQVAYRTIEKRHGFVKVRRKVMIEVDPETPRREAPAPAPPAPVSARPAPPPPAPPRPEPPPAPPAAPPRVEAPLFHPDRPERADSGPAERRDSGPERGRDDRPRERGERGGRFGRDRDRPPGGGRFDRDRPAGGGGRFDRDRERPDRASGDRPAFADRGERGGPPRERRDRWEPRPSGGLTPPPSAPPSSPRRDWSEEPQRARSEEFGALIALPDTPRRPSDRYLPARGPQAEAAARGMELLLRIAGLRLEARVLQGEEDRLEIDLTGEDADWCFSDEGEFLGAVEHLLPRIIRSLSGEAVICRVDCDNFHEIREERLRSLAQRMASEVQRLGRARTLEPMNPADRRVVHMTLADDPHVVTESEGEGYFKRITIRPA
jgi:predicted RNA-binding protein Jag